MNFINKISKSVNQKDWDNLLKKQTFSTAFQTANYDKPLQLYRDCQPWYITVENDNGEIVGQLYALMDFYQPEVHKTIPNFFIKKFNLGSRIFWNHGPIIHDKINRNKILIEILMTINKLAKEYQIDLVSGTSCPLDITFNPDIFKKLHFEVRPWLSYIVNLTNDPQSLFSSLDKKVRYDIRKGQEKGLVFEIANKLSDLIEFGQLKFKLRNKTLPKYDKIVEQKTWEWLYKENIRKLFLVKFKNELIGGINANIFNGNLYQTSVTNSHKELNGGPFLTWNAICWSVKEKIRNYDFGGANPNPASEKEKGIDFYKSKWGGKPYNQQIFTKIYHPKKLKFSKILVNPKVLKSKFLGEIQS